MKFNDKSNIVPVLILASVIIIWSISFPIIRELELILSAQTIVFYRVLVVCVFMFIFVKIKYKRILFSRKDLKLILIIGLMQIFGCLSLITTGLEFIPASGAIFIAYSTPLFIIPISLILKMNSLNIKSLVGLIIGFLGLFILFVSIINSNNNSWFGIAVLLLSTLSWSISIILIRRLNWHGDLIKLLPWQLLVGLIAIILFNHTLYFQVSFDKINIKSIVEILFLSFGATGYAFWASTYISRKFTPQVSSLSFMLTPILGTLFSFFIFKEEAGILLISSQILIFMGITITLLYPLPAKK